MLQSLMNWWIDVVGIEYTLKKTEYTEEERKLNLRKMSGRFYDFFI